MRKEKKRQKKREKLAMRQLLFFYLSLGADLRRRGVKRWGNGKWRGRRVVLRRVVAQYSGGWVGDGVKSEAVGRKKNSPGWEN